MEFHYQMLYYMSFAFFENQLEGNVMGTFPAHILRWFAYSYQVDGVPKLFSIARGDAEWAWGDVWRTLGKIQMARETLTLVTFLPFEYDNDDVRSFFTMMWMLWGKKQSKQEPDEAVASRYFYPVKVMHWDSDPVWHPIPDAPCMEYLPTFGSFIW